MSRIPKKPGLSPEQDEVSFLDPWAAKHDGIVPGDAQFVGAWRVDLGIDDVYEALFLQRGERQDWLWSIAIDSEESMREGLIRRRRGDADWAKSKLSSGCVAGSARRGSIRNAAARLVHSLVRARVQYGSFEPPFIQGLLTRRVLAHIVEAITNEFKQNIRAAEAEEQRRPLSIVTMARELGLNPRPAGHNDKAWIANCPRTNHWLMISAEQNQFGCGYCRRNGGPAELHAFYNDRYLEGSRP